MPTRDVYLKIEQIADYSPVDPDPTAPPPILYRRDCMRNPGHEDGTIPVSEVNARTLNALVYREYLDPNYLIPKPDKLILTDINEPAYYRRVPGAVIYAQPGERLRVHVLNADTHPHSFHLHGFEYGIDSDGSWPFGTQSTDGRRSDEICPGEMWTYTFDITGEMMGAWPFHDHSRHIAESVERGLFGGVIVQPPGEDNVPPRTKLPEKLERLLEELRHNPFAGAPAPRPPEHARGPHRGHGPERGRGAQGRGRHDFLGHRELRGLEAILEEWVYFPSVHPVPRPQAVLHVPVFFHRMRGTQGRPAFDSGPRQPADPPFEVTFGAEGTFPYHCGIHSFMRATVRVAAGGSALETVEIRDDPMRFTPAEVTVQPGGTVRWVHNGFESHTVTEDGGGGLETFCLNGRAFVGNTPTVLADAGQRIRWYVFNLDLGMMWHNFHPHAQRWRFANDTIDVRSLGPAESFVVETEAPPVLLLRPEPAKTERGKEKREEKEKPREYRLRGDFPFHCHVEMHMMSGMVGLVRSHQTVRLAPAEADEIAARSGLPFDPGNNGCPEADPHRCETLDLGRWELVPETPGVSMVTMMHAALLPKTRKVLFWGYNRPGGDQTRLWDYGVSPPVYSVPANQPADTVLLGSPVAARALYSNLHSAAHAYTDLDPPADGTLLAHGAETDGAIRSFRFNPNFVDAGTSRTGQWTLTADSVDPRFYATTITLEDGKLLTLYGTPGGFTPIAETIEVYNSAGPGNWEPAKLLPLQDSDGVEWDYIFYPWTYLLPGGDLFISGPQRHARRFNWRTLPAAGAPRPVGDPTKRWAADRDRSLDAPQTATSVLLPLRRPAYAPRVLNLGGNVAGAERSAEMINLADAPPVWRDLPEMGAAGEERGSLTAVLLPDGRVFVAGGDSSSPLPTLIFDPEDPDAGFARGPSMTYARDYHSAAILLADGSVLMGGDPNSDTNERYFPGYFFKPRPQINAPGGVLPTINYGSTFNVPTRAGDAPTIGEVVILRPGAVTHGFDMSQRLIECEILARPGPDTVQVKAPPDGTYAPPGYYLLFIVNAGRVPSEGVWMRLTH